MADQTHCIEEAQAELANCLRNLEPTGELSFEALLADALSELTKRPFHVAKSGHQEGSDVRSEPYNLFQVGLEAKRYGSSSKLSLDALRHKITDAVAARRPVDLWILAATRSVSAQDREELKSQGDRCGISVLVLDWPDKPARLRDLAVICGAAVNACERILKPTTELNAALDKIRSDIEFDQTRSWLLQRLTAADVGYANAREVSAQWVDEAQSSLANAKSRLGGHHNLRESEIRVIHRATVNSQLDEWHSSDHCFAAVLGDEGTGKSWAVLDWHDRLRSSVDGAPLTVFLHARAVDTAKDVRSAIAHALEEQTGVASASFWKKRLKLWESCSGDGVSILVVIDGLNENYRVTNWSAWLQPLFEDQLRGMYRVVASCWPDWWRTSLVEMVDILPRPKEVVVERFSDAELDALLDAMNVARSDFAPAVLELMRVPRLSTLVMKHRERLRESGDVTAERVVYEDWKDRLARRGSGVVLTDEQMKGIVAELGRKLQNDLEHAMSRGDVARVLFEESGKPESSLEVVVAELSSGRWLQPGQRRNTFKVAKDRIPYVVAAALVSDLSEESDAEVLETKIADFLDPLKAHSLGAAILRAATTIALIETEISVTCQKVLMEKWLEEQNFRDGDFEAFWRVIGFQPDLFLDLVEEWWLARRGRSFFDETFIKAIANAAGFPRFQKALQVRLATWLGTAWPDPKVGEFLGKVDGTTSESKRRVENTRMRYTQWSTSQFANAFVRIRLDDSNDDWSWLSARALAILSYVDRAPYERAFEAWALSRSVMERPRHEAELAWVLRLNPRDERETRDSLGALVGRLGQDRHPISRQAAKFLEAAMSDVRRTDAPLDLQDGRRDGTSKTIKVPDMPSGELLDAARECLRPHAWKNYEPESAAKLINALVSSGNEEDEAATNLVLEHLTGLLPILTIGNRRRLCRIISTKLSECDTDPLSEKKQEFKLHSSRLALQLYDGDPKSQSRLVLNRQDGAAIQTWLPMLQPLNLADIGKPEFNNTSDANIAAWLDYLAEKLCHDDIRKLKFLPGFTCRNDVILRKAALRLAIHGRHRGALERFSRSPYSRSAYDGESTDREHEYLRNHALLELHHFKPPQDVSSELKPESVALVAKHNQDDAAALDRFNNYMRQEFSAIRNEASWSSPRYWRGYREAVTAVASRDLDSVLQWLHSWMEDPGCHLDRAFMDYFPVMDTMYALRDLAPKESIDLYRLLMEGTRGGVVSSEGIRALPFSVAASADSNELCSRQLTEAIDDKTLSKIAYLAHEHSRLDWLFDAIEELTNSGLPLDVAKAYTLLGFCDKGGRADALLKRAIENPPTDAWLRDVLRSSAMQYRNNEEAYRNFSQFWSCKSSAVARDSIVRVQDSCDVRILLWIDAIKPDFDNYPLDRRVMWSWIAPQLDAEVRKARDRRKKTYVHTKLAYSVMHPWRE